MVAAPPVGSNGTNSSFSSVTTAAAPGSSTASAAGAGSEAGWLAGFSTQDYWVVKVGRGRLARARSSYQAVAIKQWAGSMPDKMRCFH